MPENSSWWHLRWWVVAILLVVGGWLTLVLQWSGLQVADWTTQLYREDVMRRSVFDETVPRQVWREIKASGLPPISVLSLVYAESKGHPQVVALDGGMGLGQVMPDVAKHHGYRSEEMLHPVKNIRVTILHFRASMVCWHSNEVNSVAGYNCGVRGWTEQLKAKTTPEPTRGLLERYKETRRRLTRWMVKGEISPD